MKKDRLWEFVYAPKTFDELILNENLKKSLKKALDERPNMLLYGPPGIGKGAYVNILINHNDIKDSVLKINASMELNIDMMRQNVKSFAQSMGFSGKLKLIYLNEIDSGNILAAQKSLRQLIEDTQGNCQFILVCNYEQNIIPELKSRMQLFHFCNPPAAEIFKRCKYILDQEKVEYNNKTIVELIKRTHPDIRNTIISLRQNVIDGKLQNKIKLSASDELFEDILNSIKSGDPEKVRKILKSNTIFYPQLYEFLYSSIMDNDEVFKNDAEAILLISEHLYRDNIVNIKEINFMHMIFKFLKNGII